VTGRLALTGLLVAAQASAAAGTAEKPPSDPSPAPSCPAPGVMPGPGVADPFHLPTDAAKQLNADALAFYRQGKWEEARQKYRAAEAADPQFLAPGLNVACSFVRQERFAEAVDEVRRLLDTAYLPWSDELATAADLGALKVRPEGRALRAILDEDRKKWAEGLSDDVLFVARTRAPLKLGNAGAAAGTFVLGPRQEVFAWSPRTRRYRQLTSEQGRVMLMARSRDGRRIAYATAEKLVMAPSRESQLRGVVIKELDLGTLSLVGEARAGKDVGWLAILQTRTGFAYEVEEHAALDGKRGTYVLQDGELNLLRDTGRQPAGRPAGVRGVASLEGAFARPEKPTPLPGCAGTVADVRPRKDGAVPMVEVRLPGGRTFTISGPFGGGLTGLPSP